MLDSSKVIQATDTPVKVTKGNSDFFAKQNYAYFHGSIGKEKLPNCLKLANITPGLKKGARTLKNNHRPVSILPIFSNKFEKRLVVLDNILSKFQYVFQTSTSCPCKLCKHQHHAHVSSAKIWYRVSHISFSF